MGHSKKKGKFWKSEDSVYLLEYRDKKDTWSQREIIIAEKYFYNKFGLFFHMVMERDFKHFSLGSHHEDIFAEFQAKVFTEVLPRLDIAQKVYSYIYRAAFNFIGNYAKKTTSQIEKKRKYIAQINTDDDGEYTKRLPKHSPYFSFENELIDKVVNMLDADLHYQILNRTQLIQTLSEDLNIPYIGLTRILKNIQNEYIKGKR